MSRFTRIAPMVVQARESQNLPESFTQLMDVLDDALTRHRAINDPELAALMAIELANYFGGRPVYVPSAQRLEYNLRVNDILNGYYREGISVSKLAMKHKLSKSRIYEIVNSHSLN